MASGSQKVKTPSGWNATQGAWVKTGSSTWKAVDQIYLKTPDGWNNASGQESTQIAYPYIANAQNPVIRNKQNNSVDSVVNIFKENNKFFLALAPEGTRDKVNKLKRIIKEITTTT